jgi:hypothetical protein
MVDGTAADGEGTSQDVAQDASSTLAQDTSSTVAPDGSSPVAWDGRSEGSDGTATAHSASTHAQESGSDIADDADHGASDPGASDDGAPQIDVGDVMAAQTDTDDAPAAQADVDELQDLNHEAGIDGIDDDVADVDSADVDSADDVDSALDDELDAWDDGSSAAGRASHVSAALPFVVSAREEFAALGDVVVTGDPRVDAATARLADVVDLPTTEHGTVYDDIHRRLQEALADADVR